LKQILLTKAEVARRAPESRWSPSPTPFAWRRGSPVPCHNSHAGPELVFLWSSACSPVLADQALDDVGALDAGGHIGRVAGFVQALTSALKITGADAATLEQYPMPACADPGGYWPQTLARIKAAGDNAGSASGLGGILLAEAPLKQVPGLEQKLTAELKKAAITGRG
jgi:hypothetical protein